MQLTRGISSLCSRCKEIHLSRSRISRFFNKATKGKVAMLNLCTKLWFQSKKDNAEIEIARNTSINEKGESAESSMK